MAVVALVLAQGAALGQKVQVGEAYKVLSCDVNGDGRDDRVMLVAYDVKGGYNVLGQLVVKDAGGAVLWRGPRPRADERSAFKFRRDDFGGDEIQVAGDLGKDGKVDLMVISCGSDVRPVIYRQFRWMGRGFGMARTGALILAGSTFAWKMPTGVHGTWIAGFEKINADGTAVVNVTRYEQGGSAGTGQAVVRVEGTRGFAIVRWNLRP